MSQGKRLSELDDDWKLKAACRDREISEFFDFNANDVSEVKEFCRTACEVIDRCLLWALYVPEEYGIWGGTDPDERARLRRQPEIRKELLDIVA